MFQLKDVKFSEERRREMFAQVDEFTGLVAKDHNKVFALQASLLELLQAYDAEKANGDYYRNAARMLSARLEDLDEDPTY